MEPLDTSQITVEHLSAPNIDAESLRQIAYARTDLRVAVLHHPNCSPELADTIHQLEASRLPQPGPTSSQHEIVQPTPDPMGHRFSAHPPASAVTVHTEQTWGSLLHLGGILFGPIPALIIWLIYKGRSEVLNQQGRTALNWQISLMFYFILPLLLVFFFIGTVLSVLLWTLNLIFSIIAAVNANKRLIWKYPMAIPFFRVSR